MSEPMTVEELAAIAQVNIARLQKKAAADHAELSADATFSDLAAPLDDCRRVLDTLSDLLTDFRAKV